MGLGLGSARAEIHRVEPDGSRTPVPVPFADDVGDPMFGFLMGVLDQDLYGDVDRFELKKLIDEAGGSKLPVDTIDWMDRRPGDRGMKSLVRIRFVEPVDVPIPYSILGYNPGSLRASQEMLLMHWVVGDEHFEHAGKDDEDPAVVEIRGGQLFMIAEGSMEMDIDGWLDRLMRGKLDDVTLSGFFVFHDQGVRIGLGFGYSNKGKGRTGAFDLVKNESIFPASPQYLALGRTMRERGEKLVARYVASDPQISH